MNLYTIDWPKACASRLALSILVRALKRIVTDFFFRLIWHQTEFHLVLNRSEKSNCDLNLVRFGSMGGELGPSFFNSQYGSRVLKRGDESPQSLFAWACVCEASTVKCPGC